MLHELQHCVNGEWVAPLEPMLLGVIDPSKEAFTRVAVGAAKDVDRVVTAVRAAFPWSRTTPQQRLQLPRNALSEYERRRNGVAEVLYRERVPPFSLRASGNRLSFVVTL